MSADEQRFELLLTTLEAEKLKNLEELSQLYVTLRNDEHVVCKKLFTINKCVMKYQGKINNLTNLKMEVKKEMASTKKRMLFFGKGQIRLHNGLIFKFYKQTRIIVTGEYLILCDPEQDAQKAIEAAGTVKEKSCATYAQYVHVCDIVKVEAERVGFDTSTPTVKFVITSLVRDPQNANSSVTNSANSTSSGADGAMTTSDRAASRTRSHAASHEMGPANSVEGSGSSFLFRSSHSSSVASKMKTKELAIVLPIDARSDKSASFPEIPSRITPEYFVNVNPAAEEASYAHRFVLALLAASREMECKGDYLPSRIVGSMSKLEDPAPHSSDKSIRPGRRIARLFQNWRHGGDGKAEHDEAINRSSGRGDGRMINDGVNTDASRSLPTSIGTSGVSASAVGSDSSDRRISSSSGNNASVQAPPSGPHPAVQELDGQADVSEMDISALSIGDFNNDTLDDALFPVSHRDDSAEYGGDNRQSEMDTAMRLAAAELIDDSLDTSMQSPPGLKSHVLNSGNSDAGSYRRSNGSSYAAAVLGGGTGSRLQTVMESEERAHSSDSEYVSHADINTPDVNNLVAVTQDSVGGNRRFGRRWLSPISVADGSPVSMVGSPAPHQGRDMSGSNQMLLSPISAVSLGDADDETSSSPAGDANGAGADAATSTTGSAIATIHDLNDGTVASGRPPIIRRKTVDGFLRELSEGTGGAKNSSDRVSPKLIHRHSDADALNPEDILGGFSATSTTVDSAPGVVKDEGISFKNLMDVEMDLARVRDQTSSTEHRLHKYLNLREFEHQLFTYLVAMRELAGAPQGLNNLQNFGFGAGADDNSSHGSSSNSNNAHVLGNLTPTTGKTPINSAHKASAVLEQIVSSNLIAKVPSFIDDDIRENYRNSEATDSDDPVAKLEVSNILEVDEYIGLDIDETAAEWTVRNESSDQGAQQDAVDKTAALLTTMEGTSELISNLVESKLPPIMRASQRMDGHGTSGAGSSGSGPAAGSRGVSKGSNSFSTSQSRTSSFSSEEFDENDDASPPMRQSEFTRFALSPFSSTSVSDSGYSIDGSAAPPSALGLSSSPISANNRLSQRMLKDSPRTPPASSPLPHQKQAHPELQPPTAVLASLPMGHPPKQLIERYHR